MGPYSYSHDFPMNWMSRLKMAIMLGSVGYSLYGRSWDLVDRNKFARNSRKLS